MSEKRARSPDRIKAPNHPARTARKPPKPEIRGSNPRGPATFQVQIRLVHHVFGGLVVSRWSYYLSEFPLAVRVTHCYAPCLFDVLVFDG
jgi:hypothetical protein